MFRKLFAAALLSLALPFGLTFAADQPEASSGASITAEQFLASLHFQDGKIDLPGGIATLNLPESFHYLNPEDTERVLVNAWGNPPGNQTLGMIFPKDTTPISESGWGVVITYDKDGHVNDDDAEKINYDDLLKDMQAAMEEANEERKKAGYDALNLVGWAEKPSYNKASHKLYWAKELSSDKSTHHSLNYNIRVLGREGVLVLNAVAGMNQIDTIKAEMPKIVASADFTPGNNYADFNSKTDHTAEYGIAALVAGGAAAKLGLFAKLFALLVAFKKFVILGIVGLLYGIKKFFSRDKPSA